MKEINKNAYHEKNHSRGMLFTIGTVVLVIALAIIAGGIALFAKGCIVAGVWATIWRVILGIIFVLFGASLGWISILIFITARSLIKVKQGNVSDVGNTAVGTININKCNKCGTKLDDDATFCTKCGVEVDGLVKCECGAVNSTESEYCKKCGKKLK